MKKVLFLMFLLSLMGLGTTSVNAQVRIGGENAPNKAAVLDLNADDEATGTKGLALPRVDLASDEMEITDDVPNLNGMLVYNTTATLGAGVYYWDGSKWVKVSSGSLAEVDGIVGNEVTDATTNGGLVRSGSGTEASPYTLGINTGGVTGAMIQDSSIDSTKLANSSIPLSKTTMWKSVRQINETTTIMLFGLIPTIFDASDCWVTSTIKNMVCFIPAGSINADCERENQGEKGSATIWCFK